MVIATRSDHWFGLFKQIDPPTPRPFKIAETYTTSDGLRTRLCAGTWASEEEAREVIAKKEQELK